MNPERNLVAFDLVLQAVPRLDAKRAAYRAWDGGLAFLCDCRMHIFLTSLDVTLPVYFALHLAI